MTDQQDPAEPVVDVHALDVGHGACTVVFVAGDGHTKSVLIDCGMKRGQPDIANKLLLLRKRVVELLRKHEVTHLDAIIVSHSDEDHTRGLSGFVDQFSKQGGTIGTVYANRDRPGIPGMFQEFLEFISKKGARKVKSIKGATERRVLSAGACAIRILAPEEENVTVEGGERSSNHLSAIVRIINDDTSLLVCGDAPATVVSELSHAVKNVDVLLASHHGGNMSEKDSEVNDAYALLNPRLVVFSAGHATTLCERQLTAIANTGAALMCTGVTKACNISSTKCAGDIAIQLRTGKRFVTDPPVNTHQVSVKLYTPRACKQINRD